MNAKKAINFINELVEKGEIKLGYDKMRQETFRIIGSGENARDIRIGSENFFCVITDLVLSNKDIFLRHEEVKGIAKALKGRVINNNPGFIETDMELEFLEQNQFIALVVDFIEAKGRYEATASELHRVLKKYAVEHAEPSSKLKYFPGGPNILSRKFRILKEQFRVFKVSVEIRRSNGCKIILERLPDDLEKQSSSHSSAQNSTNQGVSGLDDRFVDLEALKARRNTSI